MLLDSCNDCIYFKNCPCGYSLHNAACLTLAKALSEYRFGRYWALQYNRCPREEFDTNCPDCPDSCPLFIKDEIINNTTYGRGGIKIKYNYIRGRNNPERHPEDFIDEYKSLYPEDIYELDYSVNGQPIINGEETYGYYFKTMPKHWSEFVDKIYQAVEMRIKNNETN